MLLADQDSVDLALDTGGSDPLPGQTTRTSGLRSDETSGSPLLAAILVELERADARPKWEIARQLGRCVADYDQGRLLDASDKAAQLQLNPGTLVRMARAGRVPGAKKVGREWRFPTGRTDILPIRPEASLIKPGPQRRSPVMGRRRASVTALRAAGGHE